MSYEQFFDDEDLKPMWGALAVKLFILKCNGYRESAKDRKALDILLHGMMKLCKSMELIAGSEIRFPDWMTRNGNIRKVPG